MEPRPTHDGLVTLAELATRLSDEGLAAVHEALVGAEAALLVCPSEAGEPAVLTDTPALGTPAAERARAATEQQRSPLLLGVATGSSVVVPLLKTPRNAERGVTLGRGPESDVRLTSPSVSRHHATLERGRLGWTVLDAGSRNGTFLNDEPLEPARPRNIEAGAPLTLGDTRCIFLDPPGLIAFCRMSR